jgi:hypothetical protein
MRPWQLVAAVAAAAVISACSDASIPTEPQIPSTLSPAQSTVVSAIPDNDPGPPFYAITGNGGFVPHTSDWAAIPFHRSLACVPAGANLLTLSVPAAFGCQLTVHGHAHWENGPGIDLAPRQTRLSGSAVPIVFVRWSQLSAAIGDGTLTLPELLALPSSIVGTASHYSETAIYGISGPLGPGRGMYKITASGSLSDGRSFRLHVNEVLGELRVVQISFGG